MPPQQFWGHTIRPDVGPSDSGIEAVDDAVAHHALMLRAHRDTVVSVKSAEAALVPAQRVDLDAAADALAAGTATPGRPAEAAARKTLDDCEHARNAAVLAVDRAADEVARVVAANRPRMLAVSDERLGQVHTDIADITARLRQLVVERAQLLAQRSWVHDPTRSFRVGVTSVPAAFGNHRPISELLDDIDAAMTPAVDPVPLFAAGALAHSSSDGGDAA